jgi:pimeloyl-ACP methyl ester carboxylesterase
LAKLGIERYHVLAHDYGDSVAQELLARDIERRARGEPGRILSVCLLNGGLFPEVHRPRPIQKLLLGPLGWLVTRLVSERAFGHSMRGIFGPDTPPSDEELTAFWKLANCNGGIRIYHRLIRYMLDRRIHRDRWVKALTDSPGPLRLIDGVHDPVSGGHMAARYKELVPNPDVVELDCGHYPQIEAPGETLDAVLGFLDRYAACGGSQ